MQAIEASPPQQQFFWGAYRETTMGQYLSRREQGFIRRAMQTAEGEPHNALDIGCGNGSISLMLQAMGVEVVATDIDSTALAEFRQRHDTIPLVMGDAQRMPFADDSFDCLVAIQCLQYFDHHAFFQACRRVLRPGGLLIFQAINRRNYKRLLRRLLGRIGEVSPAYNMTSKDVLRAIGSYGFNVEAVNGYNWVPFDRYTNNPLVGAAALFEDALRLDRYYGISPWIIVAARKR